MVDQVRDEKSIFFAAIEHAPGPARDAFVADACSGLPDILSRVKKLLAVHDGAAGPLDSPPAGLAAYGGAGVSPALTLDQATERVGTNIGPYKLLEQIGEGGMGVVYMAQQTQPVKRKVALKVIKPGMDSRQVIARFEAERQALAMMDHPNIARIYDAGTTAGVGSRELGVGQTTDSHPPTPDSLYPTPSAARPYFVMELVRGLPITDYCDRENVGTRRKLELFADVCRAVQHAHQKGIIHRDLKPSNVLVTLHDGEPVIKVIDFGVAKALNQELTERTLFTQFSQMIGTPLYMSPEQAELSGLDIDTRSDVYSLGVMLYEMLTGTTPFDKDRLKSVTFDEMRRIIREEEPETVSQRLARTRSAELRARSNSAPVPRSPLRAPRFSELDWIVARALEKDRSRRYESASSLAADIQRYLSDEPVLACPPTTMYRFQKFARKHKPALVTAAAIAASLLLGTTVSAWQAVRATTAEAQAVANEQQANTQRDEAQKQRDEIKALYEKLAAKEQQLQRTLYASNMNLAKHAWDASSVQRVEELLAQHRPQPGETDLRGFEWHYLNRLGRSQWLTLKGHSATIDTLAYSPDGKRLATSAGKETKVWDAQTGRELLALNESSDGLAFSPDGKQLATCIRVDRQSVVKLWDAVTGKELLALKGHTGDIGSLAFSPDGKRLACGAGYYPGASETVTVLNAKTGEVLLELKNAGGYVAFSPDGQRLATARGDSGGKVWDANTGTELLDIPGRSFWSIAYSPDGKHLAGGGDDGATIWDAQTGKELRTIRGQFWSIDHVSFSPDGKRLAGSFWRAIVQIWDVQSGEEVRSFKGARYRVAWSPDGKHIACPSSHDNTVKIFDAHNDQEQLTLKSGEGFRSGAFSPDFKRLASGSRDGTVTVRDLQTGQVALTLKGHEAPVHSVVFSPDGKRLASGGGGKASSSGWGFSAGNPVELKLWDLETAQELLTVPGLTRPVVGLAFSPDGKHLAATIGGGPNSDVTVWDVHSGQELRKLVPRTAGRGPGSGLPSTLTYSPDGKRLACSRGTAVTVWDAQSGEELLSLGGSSGSVAFSSDGMRLASGGKVWDAQTGQELLNLKGHNTNIYSMTFSPDGRRIASGSRSETKVWDAETGHELLTFGSDSNVGTVAFSPSGHWLASASGGTIKIRDATPLLEKP